MQHMFLASVLSVIKDLVPLCNTPVLLMPSLHTESNSRQCLSQRERKKTERYALKRDNASLIQYQQPRNTVQSTASHIRCEQCNATSHTCICKDWKCYSHRGHGTCEAVVYSLQACRVWVADPSDLHWSRLHGHHPQPVVGRLPCQLHQYLHPITPHLRIHSALSCKLGFLTLNPKYIV